MEEECFGSLGCSEASSKLADEQVGETVPGPTWLYPRHVDAVRPLRTQGAQNIRTRGSLPHERSYIRTWLAVAHHHFLLAGREESIYGYMTASGPTRVLLLESPLTSWAGPYMSQSCFSEILGVC